MPHITKRDDSLVGKSVSEIEPDLAAPGGLFVKYDAHRGGSPISGAMVVEGLAQAGWRVQAVFGSPGPLTQRYEKLGCTVHIVPHGQWLRGGSGLRRLRRLGSELWAILRFLALLKRIRPQLVERNDR